MMNQVINIDLDNALKCTPVILELGCGRNKSPIAISIDKMNLPDVDIVADIEDGLDFILDDSIDRIYYLSCFEHIRNVEKLMTETVQS